jgi:hypothetical protein
MLEAASFSLRALLVFHPRVRGGDRTAFSSGSEVPLEPLEGTVTTRPVWALCSGSEARISLAASEFGGLDSGRLLSTGGSFWTAVASGSRLPSSFSASKLFLFSKVASSD